MRIHLRGRLAAPAIAAVLGLLSLANAQGNLRPGTDVSLSNLGGIGSPSGSRNGTFPNGTQSWGVSTTSCNVGAINVPWLSRMNVDHPSIAMFMYREYQGRFEQISKFMGVKHGFTSTNSGGCTPSCPGGAGSSLVLGCSDTYGASLNYSHDWMAPPSEIDPWSGIWASRGSHFDRGYPPVSGAAASDNQLSSINFPAGNQGYRNIVYDTQLNVTGATFWVSGYYNVIGEPDLNRENNFATRTFTRTWGGSSWSFSVSGTQHPTPAIYRWTGATVNSASNGNDDGRFYVAVKVTGPTAGLYHYEYAVFNRDNARQGASVRIPVCDGATVTNLFFRDTDDNAGNQWSMTRTAGEIVFTAPAANANNLTWGNLFNFAFDSDAAPALANVNVDEALAGAGAAAVAVQSSCPMDLRNVYLGVGCGTPSAPTLTANGPASLGNAAFSISANNVAVGSTNYFIVSLASTSIDVGNGCTIYVDPAAVFFGDGATGNASGIATLGLPIPSDPALGSAVLVVQGVEFQLPSGSFGNLDLTNGLKIKLGTGNAGCN